MLRNIIIEAIGTFFFVLVIGQVVVGAENPAKALAPLAIGSALMVVVYAGGRISGGHYNPAVTLAAWIRGKIRGTDVVPYWIAQFLGAIVAAIVVNFFKAGMEVVPAPMKLGPALLAEFLFTFALCYVVLNTAMSSGTEGNSFFGLAIGFTVLIGVYAVGGISGGVFNPAVGVGITLMGISAPAVLGLFILAHLVGGAIAALVFNALELGSE